jgi:hypothetical protein
MYNRENFNRGKFNTSSASLAVTGVARLALTGEVGGGLGLSAPQSNALLRLGASGSAVRRFMAMSNAANIALDSASAVTKRLFAPRIVSALSLMSTGTLRRSVFAAASSTNIHLYNNGSSKRRIFTGESEAALVLLTKGNSKRRLTAVETAALLTLNGTGHGIRHFTAYAEAVSLALTVKGAVTMLGYATIALPGLIVPPGGDLVIDTEQMTVTLNGDDVTRYFDAESEFFKLKPGENIVVFEDGAESRNVSIKILWKDLWL